MLNRVWQNRLIAWTDTILYVARGEQLIDTIPLHEIDTVKEMNEEVNSSSTINKKSALNSSSFEEKASPTSFSDPMGDEKKKTIFKGRSILLHIKTISDGFNAGRSYYLKAIVNASDSITVKISAAARAAKRTMYKKSLYQVSREMAKLLHQSFVYQTCGALLILMVTASWDDAH
jgi:hypothetical protein